MDSASARGRRWWKPVDGVELGAGVIGDSDQRTGDANLEDSMAPLQSISSLKDSMALLQKVSCRRRAASDWEQDLPWLSSRRA